MTTRPMTTSKKEQLQRDYERSTIIREFHRHGFAGLIQDNETSKTGMPVIVELFQQWQNAVMHNEELREQYYGTFTSPRRRPARTTKAKRRKP